MIDQVAYFAALLARSGDGWDARDIDLDTVTDIDSLAEMMREFASDDDPALLLLEQEDMWFAVVRVDGEDDPRVFVSDAGAAARSAYGDLLLARVVDDSDELAVFTEPDAYEDGESHEEPNGPAGDPELLADLDVPASTLLEMCAGSGMLPTDALAEISERAGFADAVEPLR